MTVETEASGLPVTKSGPYNGNGSTSVFDYDFQIQDQEELILTRQNADGSETTLVLTTDYTVSGVGDDSGGQITLVDPANDLPTGTKLVIQYTGDYNQSRDWSSQGGIDLAQLENALDKITMHLRQLKEVSDRAVTVDAFGSIDIDTLRTNINILGAISSDVSTVAGISANVTTVAGISGNVTTVAGISADVTTVAGISGNVTTVAGISANVTTVAGISADVTTVAGISADVTTVAGITANIAAVVADEADIGTVSTNIANVNTVAGIDSDVTTVAGISANVTTVAGVSANVTTVAGISSDVTTVAGISSSVTTVAGIDTDVTTVSGISANVTTVAGISANVTTVAGISANVTTVAGISADVTTVAGVASDVTGFHTKYLGSKSSNPTLDNSGGALIDGALHFNTTANELRVYDLGNTTWLSTAYNSSNVAITGGTISDLTSVAVRDGSASSPSITNQGDTNTGVFFPATDTVAVAVAGAEALRVNSTGLGLGSAGSVAALLDMRSSEPVIRIQDTDGSMYHQIFGNTSSLFLDIDRGSAGSGSLIIRNAASEIVRIDSSGNVGLDTSSPTGDGTTVHIHDASNTYSTLHMTNSGTGASAGDGTYLQSNGSDFLLRNRENGYIAFYTNNVERARLLSGGQLVVGGTTAGDSAANELTLVNSGNGGMTIDTGASSYASIYFKDSGSNNAGYIQYKHGDDFMRFQTNGSERVRLDSSGNLLIGHTDIFGPINNGGSGVTLTGGGQIFAGHAGPAVYVNREDSNGDAVVFRKDGAGVGSISVTGSATAYNTSSDRRLKTNIDDAGAAGSTIDAIRVVSHDWKAGGDRVNFGFISQELNEVYPAAVTVPSNCEEMQSVDYSKLVPLLVKETQDLRERVKTLEGKLHVN